MRPGYQVLQVAISELEGTHALLMAAFHRPGAPGCVRYYFVSSGPHGLRVACARGVVHLTSARAAIAHMSRDGRLALESVDLVVEPDRVLEPLPLFGPNAGVVDSAEEAHAAATTIQRAFLTFAASARRVRRAFMRAYATAATETLGAGRPRHVNGIRVRAPA